MTVKAFKVAAYGGHGEYVGPGHKMEQRLLLDRVDGCGNCPSVDQRIQGPIPIFPHATDTPLSVLDRTAMKTEMALDNRGFLLLIEHGLSHRPTLSMHRPSEVSPYLKTSEPSPHSIRAYPGR